MKIPKKSYGEIGGVPLKEALDNRKNKLKAESTNNPWQKREDIKQVEEESSEKEAVETSTEDREALLAQFDSAMDDAGFVEFLAKHPKAEKLSMSDKDAEKILGYYEVYKSSLFVSENLGDFISEEIKSQIGLEDFKPQGLQEEMEKLAFTKPEKIIQAAELFRERQELDQAIKNKQEAIDGLLAGQKLEDLEQKQTDLEKYSEMASSLNIIVRWFTPKKHLLEKYGIEKNNVADEHEKTSINISNIKEVAGSLEQRLKSLQETRLQLIKSDLIPAQKIAAQVREGIKQELVKSVSSDKISIDKVSENAPIIQKMIETSGGNGGFEFLNKTSEKELKNVYDSAIYLAVFKFLGKALNGIKSPRLSLVSAKIEEAAGKIIGVGDNDTSTVIVKTLRDILENQKDIKPAKKLLIKRLIAKFASKSLANKNKQPKKDTK